MNNKDIPSRFDIPIEDARSQALSLYQSGWLLYPEYQQITAHLSNARTYLLWAAQRHEQEAVSQPVLFGVESEARV